MISEAVNLSIVSDPIEDQPLDDQPRENEREGAPFAFVRGEPIITLPKDLYIPPDALEVFLEAFEGPLDLLLYLIKRQNLDILDIPIAVITQQYMDYVELMKEARLELAAEYLVMAAMLAEIKSRMLLPRPVEEIEEDDPRAELIRRLQEYERFKQAAVAIDELPRLERDVFQTEILPPECSVKPALPDVQLRELMLALKNVLQRSEQFNHHHIQREPLSVRERMSTILNTVSTERFTEFAKLFSPEEGRRGVVVTLMAILELIKEQLIELNQSSPFSPLYIKSKA